MHTMHARCSALHRATTAAAALLAIASLPALAAAPLAGVVTSAQEGRMEGVLVSAQRRGTPITITVVSDADGAYRFPEDKLTPGKYDIRVRAAGYDLASTAQADVGAKRSTNLPIRLKKTSALAAQLTNAEWMSSMPGRAGPATNAPCSTAWPATHSNAWHVPNTLQSNSSIAYCRACRPM